jgi:hypothetical protein
MKPIMNGHAQIVSRLGVNSIRPSLMIRARLRLRTMSMSIQARAHQKSSRAIQGSSFQIIDPC